VTAAENSDLEENASEQDKPKETSHSQLVIHGKPFLVKRNCFDQDISERFDVHEHGSENKG
jgi:hypothetical protein